MAAVRPSWAAGAATGGGGEGEGGGGKQGTCKGMLLGLRGGGRGRTAGGRQFNKKKLEHTIALTPTCMMVRYIR